MKKGPFAVNATVSRAALLAEWGRYSEALYAIETAESVFDEQNKGDRIPGSDRQFAWIRACALQGLGRIAEAEKAFARALGDREWRDPDFVIQNDREVQLRARFCMRQADKVAEVLVRNLNGPGLSSAPILLQPGYTRMHVDHRFLDSVRADPGVAPKAMGWVRVLPEEMRDAINGWREQPAQSTTAG